MKKKLITILCGALVLAMAVPALATHELGGIFRAQAVDSFTKNWATDMGDAKDDQREKQYLSQRLRVQWKNTLNDYVMVVWYGEMDWKYGEDGKAGKEGSDGVNVESKHAYATIKLPIDLDAKVTVGMQNINDAMDSAFYHNDVGAITAAANFGTVKADVGYAKRSEGADDQGDDIDMYLVRASVMPADNMKFGAEIYYIHDGAGGVDEYKSDLYTFGLNAAVKGIAGMVDITGWLAFQSGTRNIDAKVANGDAAEEQDISTNALAVKASAKLDPASVFLKLYYFGNDTDKDDDMGWEGFMGGIPFFKDMMPIMLANGMKNVGGWTDQVALTFVKEGFGMFAAVLGADANFAPFFVSARLGMFNALDKERNDSGTDELKGTNIGTEIAVKAGMKVADAAKLYLLCSYAMLGDAFEDSAVDKNGAATDPDDQYYASVVLDVPF